MCSCCGHRDSSLKDISIRKYECSNEIDRDLNASINISYEGINRYMREVLAS